MTDYQKAELKLRLLETLIQTTSKFGLEKGEVIPMAEKFCGFMFEDIVDDRKKDSEKTSSGKKQSQK